MATAGGTGAFMRRNDPTAQPSYRHHKASGQAVVTIGGKDHYLGRHGSPESHAEYDRLIAHWRLERAGYSKAMSVAELVERFLNHAKTYYIKGGRQTSEYANFKRAVGPLLDTFAALDADRFSPKALKRVREAWITSGRVRTSINHDVRRIVHVFKWDVEEELVQGGTHYALSKVSGIKKSRTTATEATPVLPVSDEVVAATLPYLSSVVADMVRFQRLTGCRPGEVCALRPMDVERHQDAWKYRPESHKTEHHGRERVIPLGPKAQAVLASYLDNRASDQPCFSPQEAEQEMRAERLANRKTPLRYGNGKGRNVKPAPRRKPGTGYTKDSYRKAIQRACEAAGVPVWAPNRVRHTTLTEARREAGLETAQALGGHASANVTQIYAERDYAKAREYAIQHG